MLTAPQFSPAALQSVLERIALAAESAGRNPAEVMLLAVSKQQPAELVRAATAAGQRDFGENYVREGVAKTAALADLPLTWHFIGQLQGNKTREVAEHFQWVHTVDRARIAERLSAQRPPQAPPLNVLLQVSLVDEPGKGGVTAAELPALAAAVARLPRLQLRGLMCIPPPAPDLEAQRAPFRRLRELRDQLNAAGHRLDTLSMGMSDDLEAAVLEGATIVRVGTAIFGQRPPQRPVT
jgi:pyridoxal phosphate enzyme (YggS family)